LLKLDSEAALLLLNDPGYAGLLPEGKRTSTRYHVIRRSASHGRPTLSLSIESSPERDDERWPSAVTILTDRDVAEGDVGAL
jgi:hypothetical protein